MNSLFSSLVKPRIAPSKTKGLNFSESVFALDEFNMIHVLYYDFNQNKWRAEDHEVNYDFIWMYKPDQLKW